VTGQTPVRRRLIGSALRRYRENLGYALADAAGVLECDRSKISRIETGQRGIRPKELRELLTEYGVPRTEQSALVRLAGHGGARVNWWDEFADLLPEVLIDYIVMESAAAEIMTYDAQVIPGLLQTAGYARAIVAADPGYAGDAQRELVVATQRRRQETVLGRGARLIAVVGEGALYQQVGGPDVMAAQLRALAALSEVRNVSLQVLPFSAGAQAAMLNASLAILRFPDAPGLGVVYLEALSGGVYREGQLDVTRYVRAFAVLRAAALSAGESARLVREMTMGVAPRSLVSRSPAG
jgi:transcriptional regulator with XRE-family HTH domain